jgi:protein ImuA
METKSEIISQLKKDILLWEGFKAPVAGADDSFGLGPIEAAFPNGIFPVGAVHEFLTTGPEHAAATSGFMGGILARLMRHNGVCLWISKARTVFPPALKVFGVPPDRVIFIDLQREKDLLWATEEALKCDGLAAVIAELPGINFTQSRRLQLAVESSKVTGFILRTDAKKLSTTACLSRWQITHLPSQPEGGLPGVGFPRWQVELLKVRNGNPGCWKVEWAAGRFVPVSEEKVITEIAYQQYA